MADYQELIFYQRARQIVQGINRETDHWLNTAIDVGLGSESEIQQLIALNTEVRKMLTASIKTIRNKLPAKPIRDGRE